MNTQSKRKGAPSSGMGMSPTLMIADRVNALRAAGQSAYSLSTPHFPEQADQLRWQSARSYTTMLTPPEGDPDLRSAMLETLFSRWRLPDNEVLVTAGAKSAIFSILAALLTSDDECLIISPDWPSYGGLCRLANCHPVHWYTRLENQFSINGPEIEKFVRGHPRLGAIILSDPGNPCGRAYRHEELKALQDICEHHGLYLIIDESFSASVVDLADWHERALQPSSCLHIVNSMSKNYFIQGLRIGACFVPNSSLGRILAVHQGVNSSASSLSQYAALDLIKRMDPAQDIHSHYRPQRRLLGDFIDNAGWPCAPNEGSFYYFPQIPNAAAKLEKLAAQAVFCLPGNLFGAPYDSHARLCFYRPMEELERILDIVDSIGD